MYRAQTEKIECVIRDIDFNGGAIVTFNYPPNQMFIPFEPLGSLVDEIKSHAPKNERFALYNAYQKYFVVMWEPYTTTFTFFIFEQQSTMADFLQQQHFFRNGYKI